MKCVEKRTEAKYYKTAIPFTAKEETCFRAYLKANDKKAGAFARTVILAAIGKEQLETVSEPQGKNGGQP